MTWKYVRNERGVYTYHLYNIKWFSKLFFISIPCILFVNGRWMNYTKQFAEHGGNKSFQNRNEIETHCYNVLTSIKWFDFEEEKKVGW